MRWHADCKFESVQTILTCFLYVFLRYETESIFQK
jgi:hypothetical protein